ncbi:MAG: c-type cytochrome [Kiloniellales bacterium]
MIKPAKIFWVGLFVALFGASGTANAEPVPLDGINHVHGIALDPDEPSRVLLATHYGLFAATSDGFATRVSTLNADFMSFAVDPRNPRKFYASGHPAKGGNLGVMTSDDGGVTWRHISDGIDGPVDFHALTVSPVDPNVLYGVYKGLQVSRDGGNTWNRVGKAPEKLFALAASAKDANILYAATMKGLQVSRDGGQNWAFASFIRRPATMVHVTPQGRLFVFVYKTGLIAMEEAQLDFKVIARDFQDRVLRGLAVDPRNKDRIYGFADTGAVMTSRDGGRTWTSFEGSERATAQAIAAGERLFAENCRQCHGVQGVGERPEDPYAKDEYGFVAPALNDDAHGWHHPDRQLIDMILNGSSRNERMAAWKTVLSREDAENLVTYIKSLWSFRSLACQGGRHMMCMR